MEVQADWEELADFLDLLQIMVHNQGAKETMIYTVLDNRAPLFSSGFTPIEVFHALVIHLSSPSPGKEVSEGKNFHTRTHQAVPEHFHILSPITNKEGEVV